VRCSGDTSSHPIPIPSPTPLPFPTLHHPTDTDFIDPCYYSATLSCHYKTPLFLATQLLFLIITQPYTQLLPLCNSLASLVHRQPTAPGSVLSTADNLSSLIILDHTNVTTTFNNSHITAITANTPTPTAIMRSNSISSVSSTSSRAPSAEPEETMQIFVKNLSGDSKSNCIQMNPSTH
jgi:hypothetical protein